MKNVSRTIKTLSGQDDCEVEDFIKNARTKSVLILDLVSAKITENTFSKYFYI